PSTCAGAGSFQRVRPTMSAPTSLPYSLPPTEGFALTHFLTVADIKRSTDCHSRVLGGTVVRDGEPTVIQLANRWIIVNLGGAPTDDKPTVTLHTPDDYQVTSVLGTGEGIACDIIRSEWSPRPRRYSTTAG